MRIAALYDIHGNLPALEAVLDEIARANIDHIVIGGDVVPGPMPRESLQRVLSLPAQTQFIYGNGEVAVLREHDGEIPAVPEQVREIIRWTAAQLDEEAVATLREWPKLIELQDEQIGRILFCHATPRNENECFVETTAEERLLPIFQSSNAAVVVCGHTHMQFDRRVGRTRVVNAGSVGMPFGRAGADWLLIENGTPLLQHTEYGLTSAAERIRRTDYPERDQFANVNILQPPTAEEMRKIFARAELK